MAYDVMVIGGGIAGMEASLTLGDAGYNVLLVEKTPSIGGNMIELSKVFPTLDCAGCITTPKMAATAIHPNVTIMSYCEIQEVYKEEEGKFRIKILKKPWHVDLNACIGCQRCEQVCPVYIPKEYEYGMIGRKAAYVAFEMASPRKALIDLDHCILCGRCERACPTEAIDFLQEPETLEEEVKSVIIATGFRPFDATEKTEFGFGKYKNVIHALQMERILAPSRPYSEVLRPSDGKVPDNIAFVLCVGSRDKSLGFPICSRVCCMYTIKQAILFTSDLPLADATIYYMDIRAFGKGFEEFYNMAEDMGLMFKKGRVAKIEEKENHNLIIRSENIGEGTIEEDEYELVVLAIGLRPNSEIVNVFTNSEIEVDELGFFKPAKESTNPVVTKTKGVFVAGCASGPKDIPDTVAEANAAATQCIDYIYEVGAKIMTTSQER
ncbi:MAG: FAD-dependent oxidoreductase [Archaeoglobaceae archaeon]